MEVHTNPFNLNPFQLSALQEAGIPVPEKVNSDTYWVFYDQVCEASRQFRGTELGAMFEEMIEFLL